MADLQTLHHDHEPQQHGDHHIVSPMVYLTIFIILLICTGLTVAASYVELYAWNAVVAIAIGCFKATLVVLYFMHVKYSSKLTKLTVGAGIFTFLILVGMSLADYFSRAWGQW
jgi:cytochrome c oxidase subunit 4